MQKRPCPGQGRFPLQPGTTRATSEYPAVRAGTSPLRQQKRDGIKPSLCPLSHRPTPVRGRGFPSSPFLHSGIPRDKECRAAANRAQGQLISLLPKPWAAGTFGSVARKPRASPSQGGFRTAEAPNTRGRITAGQPSGNITTRIRGPRNGRTAHNREPVLHRTEHFFRQFSLKGTDVLLHLKNHLSH